MPFKKRPEKCGLYDPRFEKENCGVGFIAHIKGQASHEIIDNACEILVNMTHRGAVGSEKNTGDGAGILTAIPWDLLEKIAKNELKAELPRRGQFSAGIIFLPQDKSERKACKAKVDSIVHNHQCSILGWRPVPTDNSSIGPTAKASEPVMEQLFIKAPEGINEEQFERILYLIRKEATHSIRGSEMDMDHFFYINSLSTKVIVYKGMLMPHQLFEYFKDLNDPDYKTHLAMVHSRFSTNTFPSWDRAQPLRFMSHNGEINTLRGNVNKMKGREGTLKSELLGDDIKKIFPIIEPDLSDSGCFDNALELLLMAGRSLPEAVMMMIPEAWENHHSISPEKRAFYEYHASLMEPWDGPASVAFTDGHYIGAVLDRNGLRPSRYYVTHDDYVIMASEVGVLNIKPENVKIKGRLQPGKMFLVNFEEGRIIDDNEVKTEIAKKRPYSQWLQEQKIELAELHTGHEPHGFEPKTLSNRLQVFGYSLEDLNIILAPMAANAKEPLGSMGNDTPLAVLSTKPRMLYDYFKQLFAQVTNPPIDSIREEIIMSLESYIGPEKNLLETNPEHCHRLRMALPFLTNEELAAIKHIDYRGWKAKTIDICYDIAEGEAGLQNHLDKICAESEEAISAGYSLIVLSDRDVSAKRVPVSALAAVGAVHQHLIQKAKRTQIGIVLESGEPREVHHFCMLAGFGVDAINPYLAYEAMWQLKIDGYIDSKYTDDEIVQRYTDALAKGMRKVFGKMGISTLDSYKGAQIFEAIGLNSQVVKKCFTGTVNRIEGADFDILAKEALKRHHSAYNNRNKNAGTQAINPGNYQWRAGGERHMWDPESIANLQMATKYKDVSKYKIFSDRQNQRSSEQFTLRGLLKFKKTKPISIDQVEAASEIVKRFVTGAMSFGSISQEAHETIAIALNRLGGKSNTGEGGENPERFKPLPNGDSKRSAIKQVASGRFGVTAEYLTNADEIQIKMAQGAKPGEGGELPGHKVFEVIAKTRYSTPGVGLISPPPHHDIYSIEDLAQLIFDLKNSNPKARISVKLVSEAGVGTIAAGVAKGHADHILISGHDGGTGASPLTGLKHAGLPWELGIAETHQTLVLNDLRSRVVLQTDGQLKTGRDCVIASILGAEEWGFSTAVLITMGCIMMRKCQLNTCPVGVATQNESLRQKFKGKADYIVNYFYFVAEEIRSIMAELGIKTVNELIGRVDLIESDKAIENWKTKGLDLTALLTPAQKSNPKTDVFCCIAQDHEIDKVLDRKLIEFCQEAIKAQKKTELNLAIQNTDRAAGTMLSHEITKLYGNKGLDEDTINIKLTGSAGQSFGAWLARGVTLELEGDGNDYVGKGLCGGKIIVYPPKNVSFKAEENVLIGNVALYGATQGQAFFRGRAAERFCVRNSGAQVVIEGIGDHGCEYMTGGRVVILGEVGRNFAAGMSGGIAYVWDPNKQLKQKYNDELVELEAMEKDDITDVKKLLELHQKYTSSTVAAKVLDHFDEHIKDFIKVMPVDYKNVLMEQKNKGLEA
ncbi:MAG: glutamate synthase large subunit [Spirochaetales bacterium]|nr:glutamate synthase large subunit [Spirochaetales bacterium]